MEKEKKAAAAPARLQNGQALVALTRRALSNMLGALADLDRGCPRESKKGDIYFEPYAFDNLGEVLMALASNMNALEPLNRTYQRVLNGILLSCSDAEGALKGKDGMTRYNEQVETAAEATVEVALYTLRLADLRLDDGKIVNAGRIRAHLAPILAEAGK